MKRRVLILVLVSLVAGMFAVTAGESRLAAATPTVQHLHFEYGPVHLNPGQNIIQYSSGAVPKPSVDGWIVGITPNLILTDGTIPPVDLIHLHHAVWLNASRGDWTSPGLPERFFAVGEEKTKLTLPSPYGYPYKATDFWILNYMLHVLDNNEYDVKLTYDIDFVPAARGVKLRDATPLWLDVQNGSGYPVFDALAGKGTAGRYTYPTDEPGAYGTAAPKNRYTIPTNGVLVATSGHLHPGGLHTDLNFTRTTSSGKVQSAHLFRSDAIYYEPAGPVSWDVSMTATRPDWRVRVKAGDVLSTTATYDTNGWSWYESMGIMVVWFSTRGPGKNPVTSPVDTTGEVTHGHLPENDNHGGGYDPELPDPRTLPNGATTSAVQITDFEYLPGDLDLATSVPVVKAGNKITFTNYDAPPSYGYGVWHTITTCKVPCNGSTGIAYPLADAPVQLDSGQLGNFGAPTNGKRSWSTPTSLAPGNYAYFCRVHPFMRGAFRVVP